MAKSKKGLTREEKLAKDRLRKKEKYAQIKNNPELYSIQKEKERARYLSRKEKKKICSIKDMTPRAQREKRKRWRVNSRNYLKKKKEQKNIQRIILENSPPESDLDYPCGQDIPNQDPLTIADEDPRPGPSNQKDYTQLSKTSSIIRRMRYNHMKIVYQLKDKIRKLERQKEVMRKRNKKTQKICDTIEKNVDEILTEVRPERKNEVKKQLLFSETVSRNIQDTYNSATKKQKRDLADTMISDQRFRKYRVLHKLPFSLRPNNKKEDRNQIIINKIHSFFEEDLNSRVAAGKKEFIKKNGIKKQKRYLCDTLRNLYAKFIKEQIRVSYSTFCKYRPYWVVFPNTNRDTCQCKLHSNVNLLIKALQSVGIVTESTGTHVINSLCCDMTQKCLERTCSACASKVLKYHEFKNDKKMVFYEWVVEKKPYTLQNGTKRIKIVTIKKRFDDYPRNVIYKLESILNNFFKHNLNITVQNQVIKQLKQNLNDKEILLHVDFSENYCLKYNQEIQSFHFGGSREQVSLHTGVLYYKERETGVYKTKSFCTMSDCLRHDASAIWAHLCPILKMAQNLVPFNVVHFLSDSPSSQYRNKNIFYMITKLTDINPNISRVTWNYQESGHGKGAPDGIGAVVKRTADNFVKYGGDVASFNDFKDVVTKNIRNVHFDTVTEADIAEKQFPSNIPGFKGTMKVHQVIWSVIHDKIVALRSLSCFECQDSKITCLHNKHLGNLYSITYGGAELEQSCLQFEGKENNCLHSNKSLSIDTSILLNNIEETDILKNLELLKELPVLDPIELQLSPVVNIPTSSNAARYPKVKILSDIRFNWDNRKFYKIPNPKLIKPKKLDTLFNSQHHQQFERFIESNRSDKEKTYQSNEYDDSDDEEYKIF